MGRDIMENEEKLLENYIANEVIEVPNILNKKVLIDDKLMSVRDEFEFITESIDIFLST